MGVKTAGVGHFTVPTAPAAGTSVTSGTANTFTTSAVTLLASTAAAIYITGVHLEAAAAKAATYIVVQLMIGGAGAETVIGQYLVPLSTASTVALGYRQIYPFIPVANGVRLSAKTADSVGSAATLVTLECINQSNVVDDGIAITTVTTVTNQLTAAQIATGVWQDATSGDFTTASSIGKSLYTTGATPGAAGGLQIAGSNAATTYATLTSTGAFTVNGVSSVSQTGDSFARLGAPAGASVSADVAAAKVDTAAIKVKTDFLPSVVSGGAGGVFIAGTNAATTVNFTGSLSGSVGSVTGAVGSVTGLTASNLDAAVSSRMATYTQPTGFLAATFPATVASPTNITAGTITTVTNLTNLPAITANWITAAGITAGALNGKGDWLLASGYTSPDNASITTIKGKTDNLPASPAAVSDIPTATQNATALLGAAVDATTTVAESVRLANAALGGKASGLAGTTAVYRDLADTKDRITATVDANGNRTAVVRNLT